MDLNVLALLLVKKRNPNTTEIPPTEILDRIFIYFVTDGSTFFKTLVSKPTDFGLWYDR